MVSRRWLIAALAFVGLMGGCSQFNTNLTIQTSTSSVAYLNPQTVNAGDPGFTITVNGNGFVSGSTYVLWNAGPNQIALTTTFVSASQVTAPVPASYIATPGTVQIAVQIPGSAVSGASGTTATTTTEVSNVVNFVINPTRGALPVVSSLSASTTSASSTPYCSPTGMTLTVTGSNFDSASVVNWNGAPRATTFVSATKLTAAITAADTAFPGAAVVSVSNSAGTSGPATFTMTSPTAPLPAPGAPSLATAPPTPTSASVGGSAFTLTINGTFLPCTVVQWNGSALPTTYVPATGTGTSAQLVATVPASDQLTAGIAQLSLFTLGPGGGTSSGIAFPVLGPSITSLSSSTNSSASTPSCSATGIVLTVNGANFVSGSVVNWNGSPRATTFIGATQLTAAIPTSDIASQGSATITVSSGGVISTAANFSVTAAASLPAPTVASLSPSSGTAGTAALTVSVAGSNFLPCSLVQWNGVSLATVFTSTTQLTATIPATDILSVGTANVSVFNPTAGGGGGSSGALQFSVVAPAITSLSASTTSSNSTPACSVAGIDLSVIGTNFVNGLVVNWNGSPRPTTFTSSTQLDATISPADTAFPGTATITVSSSTTPSNSLPFTLSAPSSLPAPTITSLTPSQVGNGSAAFMLGVNGNNLTPCAAVQWNGASRTTLYIGTTGLNAAISAADVASVGTAQISVVTPAPGGGTSNALTFKIYDTLAAVVQKITPSAVTSSTSQFAGSLTSAAMSGDKRYAAFVLASTDGVTETPGAVENVFVRDTCAGAPAGCAPSTSIVSVGIDSNPADGNSISPSISADGRYVAFVSSADNLVAGDTNGVADVFVRDTCAGVASGCVPSTQRVSVASDEAQANGASVSASIGASGRYVVFQSGATNLDLGSGGVSSGIFLRDTCAGTSSGCTPSTHRLNTRD